MTLCPNCGVEVEDSQRRCPLCRVPLHAGTAPSHAAPTAPQLPRGEASRNELSRDELPRDDLSRDERESPAARHHVRGWVLELSTLLASTSAIVVLAIDFGFSGSITWSRYPLASMALLWLSTVLILLSAQRVWIYLPAQILAANLFLFLLDRFASGSAWFWPLALPLTLLLAVLLAAVLAIVHRLRPSPLGTVVIVMLAAGAFTVGLELLLHRYLDQRWFIRWSAVAVAGMLPVLLLMLYLRGWFHARRSELRKLLHM